MDKDAAITMEVRFTEPADIKLFGDGWHRYDELTYIMMPGRDLVALETELTVPVELIMRALRAKTAYGELGAAWLAVRRTLPEITWEDFNPLIKTVEWRTVEDEELGKAPSPDGGETPSETATDQPGTPATPSTPVAESPS